MHTIRQSALFLVILLLGFSAVSIAGDASEDTFDHAITAFKQGDYPQAIAGFEEAARLGIDVPALYQNLGASYYSAGQYDAAEAAFEKLSRYKAMAPLAYYNLGLVNLKKGYKTAANTWFHKAYSMTGDLGLKNLAGRQLRVSESASAPAAWFTMISAAVGYDDNVTLENDSLINTAKSSAMVTKLFAYTRGILWGKASNGLLFKGNIYSKLNGGQSQINIADYKAGLDYVLALGQWNNALGVSYNHTTLGGNDFLNKLNLSLESERQITHDMRFKLRLRHRVVSADTVFSQLDGSSQDIRLTSRWKMNGRRAFDLFYQLSLNDRDDRQGTDVITGNPFFFSSSPTRHRIRAIYKQGIAAKYTAKLATEYRLSQYNDDNIEITGPVVGREDTRVKGLLGLIHDYRSNIALSLEYEYVNNDSNIARFSYSHNTLMGKVQYIF